MISCDWSSDVCSSDLSAAGSRYPNELPGFRLHESAGWSALEPLVSTFDEIGRASCRERV